jgi:hypothetical protein
MATGNYFSLLPLIMQRLQDAQIEGLGDILPARDLHLLEEGRVSDACVYVLYDGEAVPGGEEGNQGYLQLVTQRWLVVLATKNYATPAHGDMDRAGPILWEINRALQGWRPGPGLGMLRKISSPRPSYMEKNALYPLAYASDIQTEGEEM